MGTRYYDLVELLVFFFFYKYIIYIAVTKSKLYYEEKRRYLQLYKCNPTLDDVKK